MDLNFTFTDNAFCNDVNQGISHWGPCVKETVFLGDAIVSTIFMYFIFAIVIYKSRLPPVLAIPSFLVLNVGLYYLDPNPLATAGILLSASMIALYMVYVFAWKVFFK